MKLASAFQSLLGNKKIDHETYLSLFLDDHAVAASFWRLGPRGSVEKIATGHKTVEHDTWKDRIEAIDALLGSLEEKTKLPNVTTTILGLSNGFLTATGEIPKDVRAEIKKLAHELDLTIAGFVPLNQAVIYKLKADEGVPPSVILLGINTSTIAVSMYKIGALVGVRDIEKHEDVATELEQALKSFTDMEVLPARILLYGPNASQLEEVKTKILHHPWTTKANFLHFPKIEIVSVESIVDAISLAGASEIQTAVPQDSSGEETIEAQAAVASEQETKQEDQETEGEETIEAQADETEKEIAQAEEILREDFAVDPETVEDANVVMVNAESLGFKKNSDVLEEEEQKQASHVGHKTPSPIITKLRQSGVQALHVLQHIVARFKSPQKLHIGAGAIIAAVVLVVGFLYWSLPRATVNVLTIPKTITAESKVTIDPTATSVNTEENIVPGRSQEKSVSGEKTIAVVGKKNIGDPARGTVTIYNKSLSTKTFNKGAILVSGSLKFTLDSEVVVASASESVGSITFGKGDAAVTAAAIGGQSNLPGGTEFTFADIPTSVATARNDSALTGGTSREVTVVTRADVDSFIKELSGELTVQAQEELSTSVSGGEHMIEGTIKTTVTEKVFDQEIDQEATELHGKLTITVSGVTVSVGDIRELLAATGSLEVPQGYAVQDANAKLNFTDVKVNKDGTIVARVNLELVALPSIDAAIIPGALAGKSMRDAQEYLRRIPGVGGVEVGFRFSPSKSKLPINRKNISVTMSVVQ